MLLVSEIWRGWVLILITRTIPDLNPQILKIFSLLNLNPGEGLGRMCLHVKISTCLLSLVQISCTLQQYNTNNSCNMYNALVRWKEETILFSKIKGLKIFYTYFFVDFYFGRKWSEWAFSPIFLVFVLNLDLICIIFTALRLIWSAIYSKFSIHSTLNPTSHRFGGGLKKNFYVRRKMFL